MPDVSLVLVEDSAPYARLVSIVLAGALPGEVEVRHHEVLDDALADLRERPADCVLLDLGLPDARGLEGVERLRAAGVTAPVVVLSGHDDEELAVATIRAGAQEYLVKGRERDAAGFARSIRVAIERHRAQERSGDLLRARADRWRTLAHLAPVGILELAPDGGCLFANDHASALLGRAREQLLGRGWREALAPEDLTALDAASQLAREDGDGFALDVRVRHPGGEPRWARVAGVLLRDPLGEEAGWLATIADVTATHLVREELASAERELRELARTDPLTGLANRRAWDDRLGIELARAARYERPLCVAVLDLDHFKAYNDRLGHQAGDALLRDAATCWQRALRASDLLARMGGDEFALLLPDCDSELAVGIVERLRDLTPGGDAGIGCSTGVTAWRPGEDAAALTARADAALYAAKGAGRGGISVA